MELGDTEIDMLRKRLEETEAAMERIMKQMGSVTEHLSPTLLAQVLKGQGDAKVRFVSDFKCSDLNTETRV